MSPYMKKFVYASLFYLAVAAVFGVLDGLTDIGYFGSFAHTHFSLLGFMAMAVFGIGYFILPRFNGSDLKYENWVPVHFWIANFSLLGMVIFRGLTAETGDDIYHTLFIVSASLQVVSIFMFVVNIWVSLTPPKRAAEPIAPAPGSFGVTGDKPIIVLNADTPVAYLVDTLPSLKQILIDGGLKPLAQPGHIDMVRANGVVLGRAASNHGIELNGLIARLKEALEASGFDVREASAGSGKLASTTLIGDVIKNYPNSRAVFQRHFGSGCFDCPGQAYESIDMACRMHGVSPDTFLAELNAAIG